MGIIGNKALTPENIDWVEEQLRHGATLRTLEREGKKRGISLHKVRIIYGLIIGRWKACSALMRDAKADVEQAIAYRERLAKKAEDAGDYRTAASIRNEIDKILGVYPDEKTGEGPTKPGGASAIIEVVVKRDEG